MLKPCWGLYVLCLVYLGLCIKSGNKKYISIKQMKLGLQNAEHDHVDVCVCRVGGWVGGWVSARVCVHFVDSSACFYNLSVCAVILGVS